jgi:hypothetical protein
MPDDPPADPWLPAPDPNGGVPSYRYVAPINVYKVVATGGAVTGLQPLPNLRCTAVQEHEGDTPAAANFRYAFASYGALRDPSGPQSAEDALSTLSTTARFPDLVEAPDRVAVQAVRPDGVGEWIFDGFVLAFTLRFDRAAENVLMGAVGVAKRCWDTPVGGALMRQCDKPETPVDVPTDLVAQLNPRGRANATPSTGDAGSGDSTYATFLDPDVSGTDANGKDYPRTFDLPMGVGHLVYVNNDGSFVTNPKRADLDALLVARNPIAGVPFDPNDPSTYTAGAFSAPDAPLTGRPWPALVRELVKDYGFGMRWPLSTDPNGFPSTALELFLKQAAPAKPVYLQERGARFRPDRTNLGAADVTRDLAGLVNRWTVRGANKRYEASFVLYPGFPSQASDGATTAAIAAFSTSAAGFETAAAFDAYRTWVLDESGEGHYLPLTTTKVTGSATSLDAVLGAPSGSPPVAKYVKRRRPPVGALFSRDANNKPLQYHLRVSTNYAGPYGLWDGTGQWQHCQGGFETLKDRIGVRLTVQDPNGWHVGKSKVAGDPFGASGVVKAVESVSNPSAANPTFFLLLTVVFEGDQAVEATADRRDSSPVPYPVTREVDARDRLFHRQIAAKSWFNPGASPLVVRDDSGACLAEAAALRTATEAGVMDGELHVPRFTAWYRVGDRVSAVQGRDLPLRTDSGGAGFAPVLPTVVSRRWDFGDGGQSTTLQISDSGLDRNRYGTTRAKPASADRSGARLRRAKGYLDAKREEHRLKYPGGNVGSSG